MTSKVWIVLSVQFFLLAVLLFWPAGALAWPAAWAFLLLFFGPSVHITRALARTGPALLEERMRLPIQEGQPLWDKLIMTSLVVLYAAWLPLMGLDAKRFGWSDVPRALQWSGALGVLIGMWICSRVMRANPFLANVVKIQSERRHRVVTTGPYRFVRHPLYAATLILFPSTALLLSSWLGLAVAAVLASLTILRAALEDRELRHKLDGYAAYAEEARYRLIPLVW